MRTGIISAKKGLMAVAILSSMLISARVNSQDTSADSLGDPLPKDALLRLGTLRFVSPAVVKEIALTSDQRTLITFGEWLTAWDAASGKELWRIRDREIGVRLPTSYGLRAMAMLADGQHFVTSSNEGLRLWHARSGQSQRLKVDLPLPVAPQSPFRGAHSVDASPRGNLFAFGNGAGLAVFDRAGNQHFSVKVPQQPRQDSLGRDRLTFGGPYAYAIFSPDGKLLALVDVEQPMVIRFLDAQTGDELRSIACTDRVVRMAFSPDGQRLAVTERDTAVRTYSTESMELAWTYRPVVDKSIENYTSAIQFSPDGKWVAVAERNQQLYLLDATTGKEVARSQDHSWNPWALAFNRDGSVLFSSGWGGTIHRWRIPDMSQIQISRGTRSNSVVAASPRGDACAYSDPSGNVHVVDLESGRDIQVFQLPDARYEYLEYSPNGTLLAAGGTCGRLVHVAVWQVDEARLLHRWDWEPGRDPRSAIEELRFSPDSEYLAAASFRQSAAHLWSVATGDLIGWLDHQRVYGLSFSADGSSLLTAGWDSKIRTWSTRTGDLDGTFEVPKDQEDQDLRMYTVCSEPSGELLATAHISRVIRLWDAEKATLRGHLEVQGSFNYGSLRFSPDGLWIAAGSSTGNVEIFDPWTAERVHAVTGHDDGVYVVGFGADNRSLYSGGAGVCYRWDLRPEPRQQGGELEGMWTELGGSDSVQAYHAWWKLLDAAPASVGFLRDKLLAIRSTVDPLRSADSENATERQRRLLLLNKMIDSKADTERTVTVRRAVSVLSHIDTPAAINALRQVVRNAKPDVAERASQELTRRGATGGLN